MITIQLLQAGVGDTILVSILPTDKDKPDTRLLIDAGYHFRTNTLPVLKELPEGSKIDRLIITHYDADHIAGARSFIKKNGFFNQPKIISVNQIWLNSFRHLQEEKREPATPADIVKLKALITDLPQPPESDNEHEISAAQASLLGAELIRYEYPWNTDFNEKAVCVEHGPVIQINDIKITILSPDKKAINELEEDFIEFLKSKKIPVSDTVLIDDAFELYLQQEQKKKEGKISAPPVITADYIRKCSDGKGYSPDKESSNGSSIAFILEAEEKRFLFLGDAHAESIITALKEKYREKTTFPVYFDAVKVAHHGSFRNNNPDLFKLIDSPKWLFSTSGEHSTAQHPDIETIACIINRTLPKNITTRILSFNHKLEHLTGLNKPDLKAEFRYDMKVEINSEWK